MIADMICKNDNYDKQITELYDQQPIVHDCWTEMLHTLGLYNVLDKDFEIRYMYKKNNGLFRITY